MFQTKTSKAKKPHICYNDVQAQKQESSSLRHTHRNYHKNWKL